MTHSYNYEVKQAFDVIVGWQEVAPNAKEVVCEATCPIELSLVRVPIKVELKGTIIEDG